MIYLDSAAHHPILDVAREAFNAAPFGNPSSPHAVGQAARDALENARERISKCLDCKPEEIYFTSTASEASALAIRSAWLVLYKVEHSPYEHHAVLENILLPLSEDHAPGTLRCSMILNNETGEIYDKPKIGENDLWFCDATAAVGHIPISFRELNCDYLVADGIKFGGIPGAAILVAKQGAPLSPMIRGGGQERGMRSGTENVPAICAMAAALEWQHENMERNREKLHALFTVFFNDLSLIPGHHWNTPLDKPHCHHILNVSFDGINANTLALMLSKEGIMLSPGGAACTNLELGQQPSHVLMAMYNDEDRALGAIRISLSPTNTFEECRTASAAIYRCVSLLRSLNP